jgi:hypothetical protein
MKMTKPGECHRRELLMTSLVGGTLLSGGQAKAASRRTPFDRTAYNRYVTLMNAQDTRFVEYYADNIRFVMGIRGKAEVLKFYRSQWLNVTESLKVEFFCSDASGAAAEVRSELRCIHDFNDTTIFGRALKAGEVQRVRGYVFYVLNDRGLITEIKGPPPEIIQPWHIEQV